MMTRPALSSASLCPTLLSRSATWKPSPRLPTTTTCPSSWTAPSLLLSPYLTKCFDFGADIIVTSLTKWLGGHGTGRWRHVHRERYVSGQPSIIFSARLSPSLLSPIPVLILADLLTIHFRTLRWFQLGHRQAPALRHSGHLLRRSPMGPRPPRDARAPRVQAPHAHRRASQHRSRPVPR